MLDANDIQVLREMFAEQEVRIEQRIEAKLDQKLDQKLSVFRDEIFAKIHSEVTQVRDDIIDVINNGVLPQIDALDRRMLRLERWAHVA
jgi:hypothetical protein